MTKNSRDEEDLLEFYEQLNRRIKQLKKREASEVEADEDPPFKPEEI